MKAWNQIFPASVEPENSKAETNSAETSSPNRVQRQSQSFPFPVRVQQLLSRQIRSTATEPLPQRDRPDEVETEEVATVANVSSPRNHACKTSTFIFLCVVIGILIGTAIAYGIFSAATKETAPTTVANGNIGEREEGAIGSSFDNSAVTGTESRQTTMENTTFTATRQETTVSLVSVNDDICGMLSTSSSNTSKVRVGRIVGGSNSNIIKHPWQASLWTTTHACGGSIISSTWIVSAAHCIAPNSEASEWTVYAGETDQDLMPVNGQASFVTDVIMHESYDEDTYENDIAMMRLKSPLKMNDKVKTICLPTADHALEPNDMCVISGWGAKEEDGPTARFLQKTEVDIIDSELCNSDEWLSDLVLSNMFCAGAADGSRDACQGDSGGPLACQNTEDERSYLVGAVSWGVGCGVEKMPGVYTNISQYIDWISSTMDRTDSRYMST